MTTKIKASNIETGAVTADKIASGALSGALGYTPASQADITTAINNLKGGVGTALDTLNELAAALGNDANYATTITNALSTKLNTSDFGSTFDTRLATKSTTNLAEGTNQYFTSARARSALSTSGSLSYNSTTGVISFTDAVTSVAGRTGDVALTKSDVGLSNVPNTDATNASNISSGTLANARLGSGVVLQYAQAVKTDAFAGTAPDVNTYTAITGLSVSITPRSTSSKILIMTTINYDSTRGNSGGGFAIFRNGSRLDGAVGVSNGIQYRVFGDFGANANADQSGMSRSFQVVDSPSTTSTLTYDIRFTQDSNAFTTYINRARADAQNTDDGRFASSIILMEIA